MDTNTFKNFPPMVEIVGGTIEVTGHLDGRSLISSLWRTLSAGSLTQDGDQFIDRSHGLLQRHLKLMPLEDQNNIRQSLDTARDMRDNMENRSGISQLRKNLAARDYKRRARKTYKLVKTASARALENFLRNQMDEARRPPPAGDGSPPSAPEDGSRPPAPEDGPRPPAPEDGSGSGFGTGTAASDPFGDAHAVSRITDVNVNDVVRVDMSAYQDEATDEEAAVFDFIGRDRSVKHVVAFAGDRPDRGDSRSIASAPVPISSHREDDSRPRFIPASIPDVPDQTVNEQGEMGTLNSFAMNEVKTSEGKRPHPVMGASVHPVDGDPYTRSFARRRPL